MGLLSQKKSSGDSDVQTRDVVVKNQHGLHARPAAMLVKATQRFRSEIWIEKDGERVNGKSIMGIMMLAAGNGSTLQIIAEGSDAGVALDEIQKLVDSRFGED